MSEQKQSSHLLYLFLSILFSFKGTLLASCSSLLRSSIVSLAFCSLTSSRLIVVSLTDDWEAIQQIVNQTNWHLNEYCLSKLSTCSFIDVSDYELTIEIKSKYSYYLLVIQNLSKSSSTYTLEVLGSTCTCSHVNKGTLFHCRTTAEIHCFTCKYIIELQFELHLWSTVLDGNMDSTLMEQIGKDSFATWRSKGIICWK